MILNGANALIETLVKNDVTACFANPGTSEMHFVSALDQESRMRAILCLFEGVATGAADGYGRIAGKPACTLLHLGVGLGNGFANLHNARRAYTPIVNVIGDHATFHREHDAPLSSDISGLAKACSVWVESAERADDVGRLTAEAVEASMAPPGGSASLILPADCAWLPSNQGGPRARIKGKTAVDGDVVERLARRVRAARKPAILMGTTACNDAGLRVAGRLAAAGIRTIYDTFVARLPRGAGRFAPDRMVYFAEMAMADLAGIDLLILVETTAPVAFFAYPGKPNVLSADDRDVVALAERGADGVMALEHLAEALGAPATVPESTLVLPEAAPSGALNQQCVGLSIARHLPEGAIISDDAATGSPPVFGATQQARPHDWMMLTGGGLGQGMPAAIGAAIAAPDRKIVSLNGDGSAMYTPQSLWTMAREGLDITVVILANKAYRILNIELDRTGAGPPGPASARLLDIGNPDIDWVSFARSLGLPAVRCTTAEEFDAAFARSMAERGPNLIEAIVP